MASVNKVILIGNLGRDPETRYTPNGAMNVTFSIAVSKRWNDQQGQQQEKTTWFRVTGWNKMAETLDKLSQSGALAKGKQVYVSGALDTSEYTDQSGVLRTNLEVRADEVQLLGSRTGGDVGTGSFQRSNDRPDDGGSGSQEMDEVPF